MLVDPYLDHQQVVARLLNEYHKHGTLCIGFDFDNTIYDYHKTNTIYPALIQLLQRASAANFTMCVYTCNKNLQLVSDYCTANNIRIDYINSSSVTFVSKPHKPYFNLLLDDRAGLQSAFAALTNVLDILDNSRS